MVLRNIKNTQTANDGTTRSLLQSILVPEVKAALSLWLKNTKFSKDPLLIGGLALSYWVKPRYTQDIDLLFLSEGLIPSNVDGFKKVRPHCFEHIDTGVELEVLDPQFLRVPQDFITKVWADSLDTGEIRVPSKAGLIALKACRMSLQDKADIEALVLSEPTVLQTMPDWFPLLVDHKAKALESFLKELTLT